MTTCSTIHAHHVIQINLLKSTLSRLALKQYSDDAITMALTKLCAKLKAQQLTPLNCFLTKMTTTTLNCCLTSQFFESSAFKTLGTVEAK